MSFCIICSKNVNTRNALKCCLCRRLFHRKCGDGNSSTLDAQWFCKYCIEDTFPFSSMNNFEFQHLFLSNIPSSIELLPSFDVLSKLSSIPNLNNYDNNVLPNPVNSSYQYLEDFDEIRTNFKQNTHFSVQTTLSRINIPFHVIGLTETRELKNKTVKVNV